MNLQITVHKLIFPVEENYIESVATKQNYGVVFEVDEATAYFYAIDLQRESQKIVDALHIYNNATLTDSDKESVVDIAWSDDERYAILFINKYPHAVFDFVKKQGHNRTGYPDGESQFGWSKGSKEWRDDIIKQFM